MSPPPIRRPLSRSMGALGVLFLTLSATTPASSVFVILPGVIGAAGSGALLAMAVAGAVALCMALVYAELGSANPSARGEYAIAGEALGPAAGFAVLGVNLLNLLLSCATLAVGVSDYLQPLVPGPDPRALGVLAIALATGLGVLNIRANAAVTGAFLLVELVALAALVALGAAHPVRSLPPLLLHPLAPGAGGALVPAGLGAVASAVTVGLFCYDGYGNAVYLSEEVVDVRRRLARAVLLTLAVTAVAELAALCAVLAAAPDLRALFAAGDRMIGDFASAAGGVLFGRVMSAAVALAILNAVIATVLMSGRQLYATARDGAWPGAVGRGLAAVHPRWGSPAIATAAAGAVAAGLCLLPLDVLLRLSGSGVTLIYVAMAVSALRVKQRRRRGGWRMPLWPAPPVLALAVLAAVVVAGFRDNAASLAASLAVAAAFVLHHRLVLRPRGGWTLRGPAVEPAGLPEPSGVPGP